MSHGGKRLNAGRKRSMPVLLIRMAIGAMCERVRQEHVETEALRRVDEKREEVRAVQSRINEENTKRVAKLERLRLQSAADFVIEREEADLRKWQAIALKKIQTEVTPVLDRLGRCISIDDYRPRAVPRSDVYRKVAAECRRVGLGTVSTHQIRDCWREYLENQKT